MATTTSLVSSSPLTTTPTTSPSLQTGLVLCAGSSWELLSGTGAIPSISPVPTPSDGCSNEGNLFLLSPNMQWFAGTSTDSDASTVAGYYTINNNFTDLSGHQNGSFSGATVTDSDPLFDPKSGALWWLQSGDLMSASKSGGAISDHGQGSLVMFTMDGQPQPQDVAESPSGNERAAYNDVILNSGGGFYNDEPFTVVFGTPSTLTSACLQEQWVANSGQIGFPIPPDCPGTATLSESGPLLCAEFNGFVTDSSFVCLGASPEQYLLVSFAIQGTTAIVTGATPITVPSNQDLEGGVVSPDGKELWFTGTNSGSQTTLYEVATSAHNASPTTINVPLDGPLDKPGEVAGWLWDGQIRAATYDNQG